MGQSFNIFLFFVAVQIHCLVSFPPALPGEGKARVKLNALFERRFVVLLRIECRIIVWSFCFLLLGVVCYSTVCDAGCGICLIFSQTLLNVHLQPNRNHGGLIIMGLCLFPAGCEKCIALECNQYFIFRVVFFFLVPRQCLKSFINASVELLIETQIIKMSLFV